MRERVAAFMKSRKRDATREETAAIGGGRDVGRGKPAAPHRRFARVVGDRERPPFFDFAGSSAASARRCFRAEATGISLAGFSSDFRSSSGSTPSASAIRWMTASVAELVVFSSDQRYERAMPARSATWLNGIFLARASSRSRAASASSSRDVTDRAWPLLAAPLSYI